MRNDTMKHNKVGDKHITPFSLSLLYYSLYCQLWGRGMGADVYAVLTLSG